MEQTFTGRLLRVIGAIGIVAGLIAGVGLVIGSLPQGFGGIMLAMQTGSEGFGVMLGGAAVYGFGRVIDYIHNFYWKNKYEEQKKNSLK